MKKRMILDILMTIIFVLLMKMSFTGLQLHEILGVAVFVFIILHLILNSKWIKNVSLNLFNSKLNIKTKIKYFLDLALVILTILDVGTGILISKTIFTFIEAVYMYEVTQWHFFFSYWLAIVLIAHVCLNFAFIKNVFKIAKDSVVEKGIIYTAIALVTMFVTNSFDKLAIPNTNDISETVSLDNKVSITEKPIINNDDTTNQNSDQSNNEDQIENESQEQANNQEEQNIQEDVQDSSNQESSESDRPTIEEFLSNLTCNGCGKRCLLTSPHCSIGQAKTLEAVSNYNETYGTNETYTVTRKGRR